MKAVEVFARLSRAGFCVFAPIPHNHHASTYLLDRGMNAAWLEFDKILLSRCDAMLVLNLKGADESRGVKVELDWAKQNKMPVLWIKDPGDEYDIQDIEKSVETFQRQLLEGRG